MEAGFSCPLCKSSLFNEPSTAATGEGQENLDRPEKLEGHPCCNCPCGHMVHSACLLRSLLQSPGGGCPVCQEPVTPAECHPVRLPPAPAAVMNGSGDAPRTPGGLSLPPATASRARTASSALGSTAAGNSAPKLARTTDSASSSGTPGGSSAQAPATPPPSSSAPPTVPPPPPRSQALVVAAYLQGIDLRTVFTPDVSRRFDLQCQRFEQAVEASGVVTASIAEHVQDLGVRIERLGTRYMEGTPQQQNQIRDRLATVLVNWLLELDTAPLQEGLEMLEDELERLVQWWDRQNF